jgi:hypothetical protein
MKAGSRPGRDVINARKVPAPAEAVNDGLHTAWRVRRVRGRSGAVAGSVDVKKFRIEELIGALPAAIAEYLLDALDWAGWLNGALALSDLGNAVTEARVAAMPDPRQSSLKRKIAEIRARVTASAYVT